MANDKPDVKKDKRDVIGWLRATGPIVIGLVGLVVTLMIGQMQEETRDHEFRLQEDRSKHEFRAQAMIQREQSETEFRQSMFEALAEKMFSTDNITERLRYFEVFQLNFHNLFNARPLYDLLAEEMGRDGEDGLRAELGSLGKRIAKNQTTVILAAQHGEGQHFLDLKLMTPDTVLLPSLDSEEETDLAHEHMLLLTLEKVEKDYARVEVKINPAKSDSDSWQSEYWTSTFDVGYYDAPFTDNTLLPDGHRIALSLWKTTDSTASLTVLEFPADFITVGYRPSLMDLEEIQDHLHEADSAPDKAEHHLEETETVDNTASQQDPVSKLCAFVRLDQRLEKVAVLCGPELFTVQIGGEDPFFTHPVDRSRLTSGNLRAYAKEIVDEWEEASAKPTGVDQALSYSVQIGAYNGLGYAVRKQRELTTPESRLYVVPTLLPDGVYYRLLAGPFPDLGRAEKANEMLVDNGVKEIARDWDIRTTELVFAFGTFQSVVEAEARIDTLLTKQIPGYWIQVAGTADAEDVGYRVYAGGYKAGDQAGPLREKIAQAGFDATLVPLVGLPSPQQ